MTTKTADKPEPAAGITAAMLAIMGDIGAIEKSRKIEAGATKYNYRGIDQVYEAIHPLMIKHGVFMTAEVLEKSREERSAVDQYGKTKFTAFTSLRMRYHFRAADGSSVYTEAEGEGMDSGDKSSNKAMAVAHKYAILQAFCVPTEAMDDPDSEVQQLAPRPVAPLPPAAPEESPEQQERRATADRIRDAIKGALTIRSLDAIWKLHTETVDGFKETFPAAYTALNALAVKMNKELTLKEGAAT